MEYQEKVLKNTDITPAQKERCEKRIEEDKKWIARLNSLARLDDGSYAGFDKAVTMAKLFDDSVIHYAEYVNGFHFKNPAGNSRLLVSGMKGGVFVKYM